MKDFKDFGIEPTQLNFTGDKIKLQRILNKEIIVLDFKIEPSKFTEKGNGKCLYIQIEIGDTKHILFTGSANLMNMIELVPKDNFPFKTTLQKDDMLLKFT
jgi:hypothetical protein